MSDGLRVEFMDTDVHRLSVNRRITRMTRMG